MKQPVKSGQLDAVIILERLGAVSCVSFGRDQGTEQQTKSKQQTMFRNVKQQRNSCCPSIPRRFRTPSFLAATLRLELARLSRPPHTGAAQRSLPSAQA